MTLTRRAFGGLTLSGALLPNAALSQGISALDAMRAPLSAPTTEFEEALAWIKERGSPDMAAPLITSLRFSRSRGPQIADVLTAVTGEDFFTDWFQWMLWQEQNPQIKPHPDFPTYKREVMLRIDDNFDLFLRPEHIQPDQMRIRLEEIAWGGVVKDGIPSLDNPDLIDAGDAEYLRGDDLVFGVSINGDVRAYPLRIMGWHEMFNEVIGGVPVALAYCTLCGSGILFETDAPGRSKPLVFGSSGFLYRSNKLMFDRETHSLWNQWTGKPVVGPLVDSGIELQQRPVVITTWDSWKTSNPTTKVLSVNTGHRRDYGSGVVYNDYFASPDLMFPAQVDQRQYAQKDYIFAVRQFGAARGWPLNAFEGQPIINDGIADTPLLLIGDVGKRSVRAYERGDRTFTQTGGKISDQSGAAWRVTEDALFGPDGERLERVAGHISYWFAWDNYLGDAATVYNP
ncbi:hypothetical protein GCM10007385_01950 [Tateyamaria omphalii]|uniref:DUF3179 domain-containing protein n=1 Tax=Tateyamaria omphalii TaxID=299262 RepID=UPI0016728DE8|nr:DUF3179 domain-containing protein [Tateyamaria omphalii]GGX38706.1 hypothetical protein GCM10007385_01950 [Tateyamaria omphalii]